MSQLHPTGTASRGGRGRPSGRAWARHGSLLGALALGLLILQVTPQAGATSVSFLHPLANFSGPVHSLWARLAVDPERSEIYALNPRGRDVRIFDQHGMEIYVFEGFFSSRDITAGDAGEILILTRPGASASTIHRLNYRGEEIGEITLKGVPERFAGASPDRLVYRDGVLYLADSEQLSVIVADAEGRFLRGHDILGQVWGLWEADTDPQAATKLDGISLTGFDVDAEGRVLFTIAAIFSAYRLSPGGGLEVFGRPGGGKGRFGVASGIAAAPTGHVLVSDRLRSVVMIFDRGLNFVEEFGYRGWGASNLIAPDDVVVDPAGNVYVSQAANRGVSVFRMVED